MAQKEDLDQHDKLDLDAPILSRRRPIIGTGRQANSKRCLGREMHASAGTGGSVPFLWEKAPGMPKHIEVTGDHVTEVPSPKPPPNRWRPKSRCIRNDDGEDEDVFTDAMDVISLSESFDVACSMNQTSGSSGLNSEALKSAGSLSPNFIIRRFLPAANALASSSVQALQKEPGERTPRHERGRTPRRKVSKSFSSYLSTNTGSSSMESDLRSKVRSYSPPMACGLDLLSPLRLKHTICGFRSPVKRLAPHVKLVKRQPKRAEEGFSSFEPKRKKEKLNHGIMGKGRVSNLDGERGVRSEGEVSMEALDSISAPECSGRNEWVLPSLRSPP